MGTWNGAVEITGHRLTVIAKILRKYERRQPAGLDEF